MHEPMLQVQMLGKFAIRCGDRVIADDDDRSRKVWLLLAYLIFNRSRTFSQQELIRINLRKGDVVARCSASQYVIMLPRANYENSCMVADRLMNAFYRRYPHSPARLRCVVQPLEPNA